LENMQDKSSYCHI